MYGVSRALFGTAFHALPGHSPSTNAIRKINTPTRSLAPLSRVAHSEAVAYLIFYSPRVAPAWLGSVHSLLSTMIASLLNRGALSLAVVSLLASFAAAEVFEKLAAVPEGMLAVVYILLP